MKKLNKIVGVIVTLALLAGLMVMAAPVSVSAGNQSWSTIKSVQVYPNITSNVYDIAPDGQTILLYANVADPMDPADDAGKLYESTDGGYTWSEDTDDDIADLDIKQIAISEMDSDLVLAHDGTDLYRSTNAGSTWRDISLPDGVVGDITSIDVSENGRGEEVYVISFATRDGSYGGGIAMYVDGDWSITWNDSLGGGFDGDVYAVALAPEFPDNPAVLAVVSEDGSDVVLKTLIAIEDNDWDDDVPEIMISDENPPDDLVAGIALATNYSYTSRNYNVIFVGLGSEDGYDANGAYTIKPHIGNVEMIGNAANVNSIAFTGSANSGTLAVGLMEPNGEEMVLICEEANSSSPEYIYWEEWKSPTGAYVNVKFSSDDVLYAGTAPGWTYTGGADEGPGAFFVANDDYYSFDGIAFFTTTSIANTVIPMGGGLVGAGAQEQFQNLQDTDTGVYMVFHSMDSGSTWKMIYTSMYGPSVAKSPAFADDNTIYIHHASSTTGGKDEYDKSTDGGVTWVTYSIIGYVDANSFSPIDGNNYWVGSAEGDGVRRTGGSWVDLDSNVPFVMIPIPGFFFIATTSGDFYVSTDMGETFEMLGDEQDMFKSSPPGPRFPKFTLSVPTKTVYAIDPASNFLVKWVVGSSTEWADALDLSVLPASINSEAEINSMSLGTGGVWFIQSNGAAEGKFWRSIDPLNPNNTDAGKGFEPITGTTFNGGTVNSIPGMSTVVDPATGIPTYYVNVSNGYTANDYAQTWVKYTDVLFVGPKVTSPTNGATVGTAVNIENANLTSVTVSWDGVDYSPVRYNVQMAYDADFTNFVSDNGGNLYNEDWDTAGTSLANVQLTSGMKYYLRVRVLDPMYSKFSTPVMFETMITSDVNMGLNAPGRIFPENGAIIETTTPAITWGAVTGAKYDFKLATDPAFTQIVEEKNSLSQTVYSPSAPLTDGTTYFWQVRAVAGANIGNWVQSAFTVALAAAPGGPATQPPPQVTVNPPVITVQPPAVTVQPPEVIVTTTPEAPETPAYIWVIIAIGAVLVVAVIVLIARTRRV